MSEKKTLPETNSSPRKLGRAPKKDFIFQTFIFRGFKLLVSGSVIDFHHPKLGGGFKYFFVSPQKLGKIFTHFDGCIFFKGPDFWGKKPMAPNIDFPGGWIISTVKTLQLAGWGTKACSQPHDSSGEEIQRKFVEKRGGVFVYVQNITIPKPEPFFFLPKITFPNLSMRYLMIETSCWEIV